MEFHHNMPTIEVIDDDPYMREFLNILFKSESYVVRTHASARSFLQSTRSENGCIVTDVYNWEFSWLDLLSELAGRHNRLPVIIITGRANVRLIVAAMKLGAFDIFLRPFDPDDLVATVRAALSFAAEGVDRGVRSGVV